MTEARFAIASCEHCGEHIEFPAEGAGLLAACPHCSRQTVLLEDVSRVSEQAGAITAAELQSALEGSVRQRRISFFYQAGLPLVALVMVLLPVAYLAFAGLAGYGVYWYGVHARGLISGFSGGIYLTLVRILLYVSPIMAGIIAVFFMFKPILARKPGTAEPVELNPAQQPRLYQLIARLSELLGSTMPRRIYLTCELNASAGFHRGWLGFAGNDLVLNLGLPLVAGLNSRQLAAVLGHELGHCSQSLAMRLSYIINRIDNWFLRVIYARDSWDEAFDEWVNSVEDWRLSLVVGTAQLAVWASRKVLLLLMLTGHAVSCFLSRQMEYHADACAMAIAGSEGLESLLIRLREQAVLESLAYQGLNQIWKRRHQLPDSVPDFLHQLEKRCPEDFHEQARQTLLNERSGWFATHPTAAQRIQRARRGSEPGLFFLEKPARALLQDFEGVSRLVTARHYRQNLRLPVLPAMLKPASEFLQGDQTSERRGQRKFVPGA